MLAKLILNEKRSDLNDLGRVGKVRLSMVQRQKTIRIRHAAPGTRCGYAAMLQSSMGNL